MNQKLHSDIVGVGCTDVACRIPGFIWHDQFIP